MKIFIGKHTIEKIIQNIVNIVHKINFNGILVMNMQ